MDPLTIAGYIYVGVSAVDDLCKVVMRVIEAILKIPPPKKPGDLNGKPDTGRTAQGWLRLHSLC